MTLGSESSINAINGSERRAVPLPKSFALKSMLHLHDLKHNHHKQYYRFYAKL